MSDWNHSLVWDLRTATEAPVVSRSLCTFRDQQFIALLVIANSFDEFLLARHDLNQH